MESIDGPPQNNPVDARNMSPQRVVPIAVMVPIPSPPSQDQPQQPAPLLDLIERATQSWGATLRLSLLTLTFALGTAMVAAAVGVTGQLALAALGVRAGWRRKQRAADTEQRLDELDS